VTPADVNLAFEILNYRYVNRRLVTILSSEKTIEEILDIDEAVGSRIFERCKGHYVKFVGKENWRLRA
jgi:DNA replication protein DnaC